MYVYCCDWNSMKPGEGRNIYLRNVVVAHTHSRQWSCVTSAIIVAAIILVTPIDQALE